MSTWQTMDEPMHPNQIDAIVITERNRGIFYWPQLSGEPLAVDEWAKREKQRWQDARSDTNAPKETR